MSSFLSNKAKSKMDINDEIIATTMIAATKASATAYLSATLASTTPELKAMYSSSLNQTLGGHAALSELAIKRGWEKPYDRATQQLAEVYDKSSMLID